MHAHDVPPRLQSHPRWVRPERDTSILHSRCQVPVTQFDISAPINFFVVCSQTLKKKEHPGMQSNTRQAPARVTSTLMILVRLFRSCRLSDWSSDNFFFPAVYISLMVHYWSYNLSQVSAHLGRQFGVYQVSAVRCLCTN